VVVSVVVFTLSRLSGDPVTLLIAPDASKAEVAELRARLGLDKSYPEQYFIFLHNAIQGDFGKSIWHREPALDIFLEKVPNTIELSLAALALSILIAIPIGVLSAVKKDSPFDTAAKMFALIGQSAPIFWIGIIMILVFAVFLGLLPTSGTGGIRHLILPAVTLGWYGNALIMRITRSSMLDVLDTEYIKLARLEGLSERLIIWKHALKNASIPIITTIGLLLIALIGGAVVTETVFAWPGLGRLMISSVTWRDYPVVQATVLFLSLLYIFANLLVDILYAYLNPRIRYGS